MPVPQHVLNWLYSVLTSEYHDVNRTYNDVAQTLARFSTLSPRTDVHTFPNGSSALLLHLSGTLPVDFRGNTYRYPISIWVPHAYPREPPLVYVTPTQSMIVRPGQHVDPQGQVYHPYLAGWAGFWDKSTLQDFMTVLSEVFAKEPPVISRQAPRPPQSPQQQQQQQQQRTPPPRPPLPPEMTPLSSQRSASQFGAPPPPPKPPKPHQEHHAPEHGVAHSHPQPTPQGPMSPTQSFRASRYDSAPPLPTQAIAVSPTHHAPAPTIQQHRMAPVPNQYPAPRPIQPPQYPGSSGQRPWQQAPQPPAWSPHNQQPRVEPPPPPPPDLLDEPLTLSIPNQASVAAPPIPPNPEKDALLKQLALTLASMRQRSRQQNESSMAGLQAQRTALLSVIPAMQSEIGQLSHLSSVTASNANILREALHKADAVIEGSRSHPKPDIDELLVAPTLVSNQLYNLVAEERALGDAIFMLGRAVERGRISPAVFAKTTRSLAREWYLKKALAQRNVMAKFDPYQQSILLLAADGESEIEVSLLDVDSVNHETSSICINYGAQLGACFIMLLMILIMTPSNKFRRPSTILHIFGLLVCTIRMALLSVYFTSPFNDFYAFWGNDYSHVPVQDYQISITANTFSLLLLIVVEAALMNQAWTMVKLWPTFAKMTLSALSGVITLTTIGWRIAATVLQNRAVLSLEPPADTLWVVYWMLITNALSICWFCALFNIKLVLHLISNRGILPSYMSLTPMEILIMTNGILMTVPVLFAGLEWGQFTNFESASLTLTSVAVILPLGTLAAQRMSRSNNVAYQSETPSGQGALLPGTANSSLPLKATSYSSNSRSDTTPLTSVLSRCEAGRSTTRGLDALDLELGELDRMNSQRELINGHVRIDHDFEQRVDHLGNL
ncbi:Tumor susceptibility protein [Paramyrothecium foliicola]|nr:Tumor susceptibility protein [Paramyrothecium foliicola]